ncbi:MAG TPA: hypothetical protein VH643_05845 [Gemmataceae bacterium]|jgi:hypothetical protein
MQPVSMAALVGATITFLGGLFAALLGFRLIGRQPSADPANEQRMVGVRRWFRLAGPLLMIFAILLLFIEPPTPPREWRTVTTSDGVCSIEMPGEPAEGEGPVVKGQQRELGHWLSQDGGTARYSISHSEIAEAYRELPSEKLLKTIGENWLSAAQKQGQTQVIEERDLTENGWPGREITIEIDSQHMRQKWFVVHNRLYRVIASTPGDARHLEDARRFLDSFRILKKPDDDKGPR